MRKFGLQRDADHECFRRASRRKSGSCVLQDESFGCPGVRGEADGDTGLSSEQVVIVGAKSYHHQQQGQGELVSGYPVQSSVIKQPRSGRRLTCSPSYVAVHHAGVCALQISCVGLSRISARLQFWFIPSILHSAPHIRGPSMSLWFALLHHSGLHHRLLRALWIGPLILVVCTNSV